jgi:hypothetical protein
MITANNETYFKATGKIDGGTQSMIIWTHHWVDDEGEPKQTKHIEHIWQHELAQMMGGN